MAIKADQPATSRQLWRLNNEGRLLLILSGAPSHSITVEQADAAIKGGLGSKA